MSTGENIRYYRKKAGLTQKALAGESNLAEITIRKYETDSTQPNFNSCIAVAKALNITEQDLFAETPLTLDEKKEPIPKKETNLTDMTIFDLHMIITNASVELARRAVINDR